jgi:hypothetical protein
MMMFGSGNYKSRLIVYRRDLNSTFCKKLHQVTVPHGMVDSIDLGLQVVALSWPKPSNLALGDGFVSTWRCFRVVNLQTKERTDVFQIVPVSNKSWSCAITYGKYIETS